LIFFANQSIADIGASANKKFVKMKELIDIKINNKHDRKIIIL
jgi:hypothetical protein